MANPIYVGPDGITYESLQKELGRSESWIKTNARRSRSYLILDPDRVRGDGRRELAYFIAYESTPKHSAFGEVDPSLTGRQATTMIRRRRDFRRRLSAIIAARTIESLRSELWPSIRVKDTQFSDIHTISYSPARQLALDFGIRCNKSELADLDLALSGDTSVLGLR